MMLGMRSGISLDADAVAYFAAMPSQPSGVAKGAINSFIKGLKAQGLWTKIDGGNILSLGVEGQAYIDFKSPGRVATPAPGLTSTFTAYRGFTGSGALAGSQTDYIDTGFIPSTAGGQMTQDSAHMACWVNTNTNSSNRDMGANSTHDILLVSRNSGGFISTQLNDGTAVGTIANANSIGFYTLTRTGSAGYDVYDNGTNLGTYATVSTGLPAAAIRYMQAQSVAGTNRQVSFGCFGGGLNSTETVALYNLTNSLMSTLLAL